MVEVKGCYIQKSVNALAMSLLFDEFEHNIYRRLTIVEHAFKYWNLRDGK
jgi:hypothetical protein